MGHQPKSGDRSPESITSASTLRAALDVLVFAPMGLGAKIVDDAPGTVRRARQEINNARFIGRLVVNQGVAQLRERLDGASADNVPPAHRAADARRGMGPKSDTTTDTAVDAVAGSTADSEGVVVAAAARPPEDHVVPDVDQLALPDYDHLPAIDIVAKLATLSAGEREAVGQYESANRQRRTVLGKLAQLAGA